MDFSKLKNKLLILLCCFVVVFPFWCIKGLCAEDVEPEVINDISFNSATSNYFVSNPGNTLYCFHIEPGFRYTFTNNTTNSRGLVLSSEKPAVDVTFTQLTVITVGNSYTYIGEGYVFMTSYGDLDVTRESIASMDNTVAQLVDNVGISNLWGVFNSGINYIVVVVLFAFGFFIIVALIKKLRKGKGGI